MATVAKLNVQIGATIKGLEGSLKKAESGLNKFAKNATAIGATMSTYLTTPIVSGLGLAVKAASDAEEAFSKFATIFRDIESEADGAFKTLANEYNFSSLAAKEALANTGDLLTGLGMTQSEALKLSLEVTKLGADLASFSNYSGGAKGASEALTKALLGEREAAKALGLVINEEQVKRQMQIDAANGVTTSSELQAKAIATLNLAYAQSPNAIGDVSRTMNSFANQLRSVQNNISDLSVEIGRMLIPMSQKLLQRVKTLIQQFKDLSSETKNSILNFTLLLAAVGPVVVVLGQAALAMSVLSKALQFTIANPFTLVYAGAFLLLGVTISLYNEIKKTRSLIEDTPLGLDMPIKDQIGVSITRLKDLQTQLKKLQNKQNSTASGNIVGAYDIQIMQLRKRIEEERKLVVQLVERSKTEKKVADDSVDAIDKVVNVASVAKPTVPVAFTVEPMADVVKKVTESLQPIEDLLEFDYSVPEKLFPPGSIGFLQTKISTLTELMRGMTNPESIEAYRLKIQQLQNQLNQLETGIIDTNKKIIDFGQNLQSVVSSSITSFAETIGNAFTGDSGAEGFFNNILLIVADFGMQLGKSLIAAGVAALAFKKLLIDPFSAIVAGTALVITSAVVKNLLQSGPKQKVNDAMITSTGKVVEFSPKDNILAMKDFSNLGNNGGGSVSAIRVSVDTIRVSGSDILIALKNTERAYG